MATQIKNTPVATIRGRNGIKATIWKNATSQRRAFYSCDISRTYKTDNGYGDSRSFSDADLLVIAHITHKAFDKISELRREDAQAEPAEELEVAGQLDGGAAGVPARCGIVVAVLHAARTAK